MRIDDCLLDNLLAVCCFCVYFYACFDTLLLIFEWEWETRIFFSERRIVITDLDLVTDLLSYLLKFKVFWLTESFFTFSYFDTSCFDAWCFSTLMLFYIDFFHLCFNLCILYVCTLSWAAAYAAACWSLCWFFWLSKSDDWDCCI